MNRFRRLAGPNSYQTELNLDLNAVLPKNALWLDVGCGTGVAVRELARLRPDVEILAVDLEAGFDDGRALAPNLRFRQGDVTVLDLPAGFDLVTAVHVLHFVADKQALLNRLAGLLKTGGRLAANVDPLDVVLGAEWAAGKPLGGLPQVLDSVPGWGLFRGSRLNPARNRQGVESIQSLYDPDRSIIK